MTLHRSSLPPFTRCSLGLPVALGAALIALAGCEKTNDVPRLRDEALAAVATYGTDLDELTRRAREIDDRFAATHHTPKDAAEPARLYLQIQATVSSARTVLHQVTVRTDNAAKAGSVEALDEQISFLHLQLDNAILVLNSELDAIDSWVAIDAQRPSAPAASAPAAPESAPASEPAAPAADDAPATGSAAPAR